LFRPCPAQAPVRGNHFSSKAKISCGKVFCPQSIVKNSRSKSKMPGNGVSVSVACSMNAQAVSGAIQFSKISSRKRFVRFTQTHLAQIVQIECGCGLNESPLVKQIHFAEKRRFWPARAFGNRRDAPEVRRQPVDNEARLGQQPRP